MPVFRIIGTTHIEISISVFALGAVFTVLFNMMIRIRALFYVLVWSKGLAWALFLLHSHLRLILNTSVSELIREGEGETRLFTVNSHLNISHIPVMHDGLMCASLMTHLARNTIMTDILYSTHYLNP